MFTVTCCVTNKLLVFVTKFDGMLQTILYPHLQDGCSLYLFPIYFIYLFILSTY